MAEANPIAQEDCERNEAGEPEDHGQAFDSGDDASVVELGLSKAHRYDNQVGQGDQGNDRAEQEEADLRWRAGMPVATPPVGDCDCWLDPFFCEVYGNEELTIARQAKYEDCEDRLNNSQNEDEAWTFVESHLDRILGRVFRRSVVRSGRSGKLQSEEYCVLKFPIEEGRYSEDFGCAFVVSHSRASLFQPAM